MWNWLKRRQGFAPKDKETGVSLDLWDRPRWELSCPKDWPTLLETLVDLLPEDAVLRFEGGSPRGPLKLFFAENSVTPSLDIVPSGTIWPKPRIFHVPATQENLTRLSEITEHFAEPEVAIHFHVYRDGEVLLDWYDAFDDPMCLSKQFSEHQVICLCEKAGMTYKDISPNTE